jgi:hypothetical protein|nr:MAG TPA: hypothetical protein [Caudoviricetes sp.]DAN72129.1 MAG TPA: hypothetical protein [Caudoviricetes sp.]DAO06611.1 MAG TPA: hypothetical protein [Caudoviricetes sp.]DAS32336.1 MAG TPA: hypothetical protein [Caudoviricetes sp.]DAV45189.1 MAG TPA: hypothetical protein [Caudoviricetes sp.]
MDVGAMIRHWITTPAYGYLGSSYGCHAADLLQLPLGDGAVADALIAKLKEDIPPLKSLPVNIYAVGNGVDQQQIIIECAGQAVDITDRVFKE